MEAVKGAGDHRPVSGDRFPAGDPDPAGASGGRLTERMRLRLREGFDAFSTRAADLARARVRRAGVSPTDGVVEEALERAVLEDLFLAVACEERAPGAWEAFHSRYAPRVRSLALRQGATPQQAEGLAEEMGGALLLPPARGRARTRLGTFDGTGSLAAWLAAVVAHRLADLRRARQSRSLDEALRREEEDGAAPDPALADSRSDPAPRAASREEAARLERAVRGALEGLTRREREAILGKYRDGLSQEDIARRMGVGSPRVSRLLAAAHGKIGRAVRAEAGGAAPEPGEDASWADLRDAIGVCLATPVPGDESGEEGTRIHG